jgi:hypothetical protein
VKIEIGTRVRTSQGNGTVICRERLVDGRSVRDTKNPLGKVFGIQRYGIELDNPIARINPVFYSADHLRKPLPKENDNE